MYEGKKIGIEDPGTRMMTETRKQDEVSAKRSRFSRGHWVLSSSGTLALVQEFSFHEPL